MKRLYFTNALFILILISNSSAGKTTNWTNGSGDFTWTNTLNWNNGVPATADVVVFPLSATYTVISVPIISLAQLTVSSGNVTLSATPFTNTMTLTGTLTINSGCSMATTSSVSLAIQGNVIIDGSLTTAGVVLFNGTTSTNISSPLATGNITLNGTSSFSKNGAAPNPMVSVNVPMTFTAPLSIQTTGGSSSNYYEVNSNFSCQTATFSNFGNTNFNSGALSFNSLCTINNSSTVTFASGLTSVSIGFSLTIGALSTLNDNLSAVIPISGNVNINAASGSLIMTATSTLAVGTTWSNSGTFTAGSNTSVIFTSTTSGQTISGNLTGSNAFNNITFNGVGGGWSFSNDADVKGNFTITNGSVTPPSGTLQVAGSWTNNGTYVVSLTTLVVLNGSSSQTIGGSSSTTFYSLTIMNGALMNIATTVNGTLTLVNGLVVNNATNVLYMGSSSSVTGASNSAFVTGPVSKAGSAAFTFPIGKDAEYRPLGISNITGIGPYVAEYIHVNPNTDGYIVTSVESPPLDHVSHCEYWTFQGGTNSSSSVQVTLSWNTYSCGVTDPSKLRVAEWYFAPTQKWMDEGNSAYSAVAQTVTSNAITGMINNPFTLASTDPTQNPLPITLVNFTAKYAGQLVKIEWTTLSEVNTDKFTVEKTTDGINFSVVDEVKAAGNSTSLIQYSSVDDSPFKGISYYRLQEKDNDGTITNFGLVTVKVLENESISVYPTVSSGIFFVSGVDKGAEIDVHSSEGNRVYHTIVSQSQPNTFAFDLSNLAGGIYYVFLRDENGTTTKKIIKQ